MFSKLRLIGRVANFKATKMAVKQFHISKAVASNFHPMGDVCPLLLFIDF